MKIIAWDIDDVLNDLMRCWFEEKWSPFHQGCKKGYEDFKENPPHRILGISLEEYLKSLDEYRLSALYQQMSPVKEVKEWFVKYGNKFRHIALTAVPLIAASVSAQWLFRHFGMWIRTFHFVPSKRKGQDIPEYDRGKAHFLRWLGRVDVLVDDNPINVAAAERTGVKGILIPRPWNQNKMTIDEALRLLENV